MKFMKPAQTPVQPTATSSVAATATDTTTVAAPAAVPASNTSSSSTSAAAASFPRPSSRAAILTAVQGVNSTLNV